jgi:hypothetical protein
MSDHEFEKQVNQKLEELKLRPSDTVWMEVEKKIRQDKRRRRFLWLWVPSLFIFLATSGYILYHYTLNTNNTQAPVAKAVPASLSNKTITETSNTSTQQNTASNTKPGSENDTQNEEITVAGSSAQTDNSKQPVNATPATSPTTLSNKQQPSTVTEKSTAINIGSTNKETIGIHNKKPVQQPLTSDDYNPGPVAGIPNKGYTHEKHGNFNGKKRRTGQKVYATPEAPVQQATIAAANTNSVADAEQPESASLNGVMPVIVKDGANDIATNKAAPVPFNHQLLPLTPDSANMQTAAAMAVPRKRPSLWHWGIVTDAGYSRISESKLFQLRGLLGTDKYLAEDLAARNSSSQVNSSFINFQGVTTTTPVRKASPIQPDFSFSAGVFVQRRLSPRFKLSLGLEYSYMSVNTEVGQKIDAPIVVNYGTSMAAVVPQYYKNAGYDAASVSANYQGGWYSQQYRYRFQYIEIPLLANWQINKGRRMPPLAFEGGFSIARLLSVKALHYEGIKGVYYQDNSLFNKTQFNFVTGLSVGLLQRSKHPLWIGPNLRYSLNGLVEKQVSTGQYLWSTGISVKMLLGRL